jgi:outer membrane beta-barrel protein
MKLSKTLIPFILGLFCASAGAQTGSDKLDVKALEQKYWAAKDDDFAVVQNRAFSKAKRFFGTLHYGKAINDPYYSGQSFGVTGGYFFNETWGVEASYFTNDFVPGDVFKDIISLGGGPKVNEAKSRTLVSAVWMPIYAKMSLMDQKILHFDMGFTLGVGQFGYEKKFYQGTYPNGVEQGIKGNATGYSLGVTQQFYFNRLAAVRVDFVNTFSNQGQINYKTKADAGSKTVNDTSLMIGLTVFSWWGEKSH